MLFRINANNGIPIYDQVIRQVKYGIANGAIQTGELIPSVREMAKQLSINPNTVARAYRQLQDDNVIERVRGTGLQVTSTARRECKSERKALMREQIHRVLAEAKQSGLEDAEIQRLVDAELKKLKKTGDTP